MLLYPHLNPVALTIGPLKIHWYGVMYLLGFLAGWWLGCYRAKQPNSGWTSAQVGDLIFYAALGVIVGGRVGYMLFYDFSALVENPFNLFKVWQGGMAFHGGCLGVVAAIGLYAKNMHRNFFAIGDFIAPLVPIGLALGRVGNFINGELFGRVTNVPWGMLYPQAGPLPRHPSEIYEFLLEGVLLFVILWWYSSKPRPRMAVSGLFLLLYGLFRIIAECFRQPDAFLGYIAFDWLTMGQLLSIPMMVLGSLLLYFSHKGK